MVKLKSVKESNANLKSTVSGQVALFVGATSGIAGHTLTEYARYLDRPKVYIVGRNDAKLSNIIRDLEGINPGGSYVPIKSEISLLKNVDAACEELKRKEKSLDLLVMCPGYVKLSKVGMHLFHIPLHVPSRTERHGAQSRTASYASFDLTLVQKTPMAWRTPSHSATTAACASSKTSFRSSYLRPRPGSSTSTAQAEKATSSSTTSS